MAEVWDVVTAAIAQGLQTRRFGRPLHGYAQVASTNDVARAQAARGAEEGTAVIAGEQTAGRGRLGRPWASPPGGLWLSVVLRPRLPQPEWTLVGFAAAAGVCAAIEAQTGLRPLAKWPNDLLLGERKVGGVLVEAFPPHAILGLGVNANVRIEELPAALRESATSLRRELGHAVDLAALTQRVLLEVEAHYDLLQADPRQAMERWRARAAWMGQAVRVSGAEVFDGIAEYVDDRGALVVRTPDGPRRVVAGDVSLRSGH